MATTKKIAADAIPMSDDSPGLIINGTEFNDTLFGTTGSDQIRGRGGRDTLYGLGGKDFLLGEAGNDTLMGGEGDDTLDGGQDDDTLVGGAGADTLIGGEGTDTVSYSTATSGVWVDITYGGFSGDAQGDTYVGVERFLGSRFTDLINGSAAADDIDGGDGDDFLLGRGGDDTLRGGAGNNVLNGGEGNDTLIAGAGDRLIGGAGRDHLVGSYALDTFVFARGEGGDTVENFEMGRFGFGGDKIELRGFSPNDLGTDRELMTGEMVDGRLVIHDYDATAHLIYIEDTQRFIAFDEAIRTPRGVQLRGAEVLATFEPGIDIHASDLIFSI